MTGPQGAPGQKRKDLPYRIVAAISIVMVVVGLCWLFGGDVIDVAAQNVWMGQAVSHEMPFDSEKWRAGRGDYDTDIRKRMYRDLTNNHIKGNMSKNEVLKLLGEPELRYDNKFDYYLGPDAIGIDTNELVIEFDKRGRLKRFYWTET
jgi:hypothetical protein